MKTKIKILNNLVKILLTAVFFSFLSCKKQELYTKEECAKLKKGDTIYTHEFYSYQRCIVINNDIEKELIEVGSLKYFWDTSILSYDDFRFKDE